MNAFKTQITKLGMRNLCLQGKFTSGWINNSAITINISHICC